MARSDPNLLETVAAYDGTAAFLRTAHLGQEELTKAIIGTIGDVDSYQLPDAKGYSAMSRYMLGITDEERQVCVYGRGLLSEFLYGQCALNDVGQFYCTSCFCADYPK